MKKFAHSFKALIDHSFSFILQSRVFLFLILFLISAKAVYDFYAATQPHGIGIRTDSVEYIWGAKNLAAGLGLGRLDGYGHFKAITHWPPFFSIVAAALGKITHIEIKVVMRSLNAILTGMVIFLTGVSIARLTRHALWFTLIGTAIFATSAMLWDTCLYAMSEPLYIVLSLAALLSLERYISTPKWIWLSLAALMVGLALFTRYIGGALIMTGGLFILLNKELNSKDKLKAILLFTAISLLPMGLWAVRNYMVSGTTTNRAMELVWIRASEWRALLALAATWFTPILRVAEISLAKIVLLIAVTAPVSWLTIKNSTATENGKTPLAGILAIHALCYFFFIVLARLIFDPVIPLDESRIILPLFISLYSLAIYALSRLWTKARRYSVPLAIAFSCMLVLVSWSLARVYTINSAPIRVLSYEKGLGLANINVAAQPWVNVIKDLPQDTVIYTDNIELVYMPSGRYSFQINALDEQTLGKIRADQKEHDVVIIVVSKQEIISEIAELFPQTQLSEYSNIFKLLKLP